MTGAQLKELLQTLPMTIKDIADRIGVSDQSLASTFRSPSVKSHIIEQLAEGLGVGMAFFYPEIEQKVIGNDNVVQSNTYGDNRNEGTNDELVQAMREQIASQAKTLDALTLALQALTNK